MAIVFAKSSGLNDSVYGKSEAPIKAFLEENVRAHEEGSLVNKLFKMVDSENFGEKFGSMTALANGFQPVGEGGAYPNDEKQEGYSKFLENITWKDQFAITEEMIEDNKILDINRTGARGFIDQFHLVREKYAAALLVGAVNGTTTTFRGLTMDCTSNDGVSLFSTAHPSKLDSSKTQSNKYSNTFSEDALGLIETAMQNYKDDNDEVLVVSPDTIVIPNNHALKKAVFAAIGADKDPSTSNNGFNYVFGRWTVIINPYLNGVPANAYFVFDKKYNDAYNGLIFMDRIPLTIKSYIDNSNGNNVWQGRARFVCGANDWREIAVGGIAGATELQ